MEASDILTETYNTAKKSKECLELMQQAFFANSAKPLKITDEIIEHIAGRIDFLAGRLKEEVKKNPSMGSYIPIPDHFNKIREQIQGISSGIRDKISKRVLFNAKSVAEINFMFESVIEILNNTADMVLARNTIVLGYVRESATSIRKTADDYETRHEEQLIEGIAPTISSTLFINMLNSLRTIAWHAKGITEDVFA
jgi:Na+/phosphate symporter